MTPIRDWPREEQPRHRIASLSPYEISTPELLAAIIGTGTREHNALELGMRIYDHFHHDTYKLGNATIEELMTIKGIGFVKAAAIVAAMELAKRRQNALPPERHFINRSRDANEFVRPLISGHEWPLFGVLYCSNAAWVKDLGLLKLTAPAAFYPHHKGILQHSLELLAVSLITFETADNDWPSQQRIEDIEKLRNVAQCMDIKVLDHMILTKEHYFSCADEGRL